MHPLELHLGGWYTSFLDSEPGHVHLTIYVAAVWFSTHCFDIILLSMDLAKWVCVKTLVPWGGHQVSHEVIRYPLYKYGLAYFPNKPSRLASS